MNFTPFIYNNHLEPEGFLPRSHAVESSAAWHFAKLALNVLEKVPEQVTLEGEVDQTVQLRPLAEAVRKLYGLEDIGTMMSFMTVVRQEAFRCRLPWSNRFQAWLDSGGKSFNEVTREEGALNIQ